MRLHSVANHSCPFFGGGLLCIALTLLCCAVDIVRSWSCGPCATAVCVGPCALAHTHRLSLSFLAPLRTNCRLVLTIGAENSNH